MSKPLKFIFERNCDYARSAKIRLEAIGEPGFAPEDRLEAIGKPGFAPEDRLKAIGEPG